MMPNILWTINISDDATYQIHKDLVHRFFNGLYLTSFPNDNEREPVASIIQRITMNTPVRTFCSLVCIGKIPIAGSVTDLYREAEVAHLIYLTVRQDYREKGIATRLIDEIKKNNRWVKDIYVEVDNPAKVSDADSSIDPKTRIQIYKKIGFSMLPFNYVQPPLGKGMDYERNLLLMCKSGSKGVGQRLNIFLTAFYKSENLGSDPELKRMMAEINNLKLP